MRTLRSIPLHMMLLAGLAAQSPAQETSSKAAAPKSDPANVAAPRPAAPAQAYVGVNVLPLTPAFRERDLATELPEGVGIVVGFVDPKGPAVGLVQEKDVLTRLDDQVLVNPEQFRTLVRNRKPGQPVKLVRVRGADVETVEVALASRPAGAQAALAPVEPNRADYPDASGRVRISINGQEIDPSQVIGGGTVTFGSPGAPGGQVVIVGPNSGDIPPEIRRQLEEMRQRGLPIPQILPPDDPSLGQAAPPAGRRTTTFSRSFTLGSGAGTSSSSSYTDEQGTVQVRTENGKRFATVKDAEGQVVFDGEVTTPEHLKSVPEAARPRIALAEGPRVLPRLPAVPSSEPAGEAKPGQAPKAKPAKPIDPREGA